MVMLMEMLMCDVCACSFVHDVAGFCPFSATIMCEDFRDRDTIVAFRTGEFCVPIMIVTDADLDMC